MGYTQNCLHNCPPTFYQLTHLIGDTRWLNFKNRNPNMLSVENSETWVLSQTTYIHIYMCVCVLLVSRIDPVSTKFRSWTFSESHLDLSQIAPMTGLHTAYLTKQKSLQHGLLYACQVSINTVCIYLLSICIYIYLYIYEKVHARNPSSVTEHQECQISQNETHLLFPNWPFLTSFHRCKVSSTYATRLCQLDFHCSWLAGESPH